MIALVAIVGILIMAILANHQLINSGNAAQENSNSGNTSQGANNTGPTTPNQVTTTTQQLLLALQHPTPIVTTTHHNIVTATSEQLSNNGILPKPTLAPKPTEPTVAPRVQGAKTIAEAQQLKKAEEKRLAWDQKLRRTGIQFDPKKESCKSTQGYPIPWESKDSSGKMFCLIGKVVLIKTPPINPHSVANNYPTRIPRIGSSNCLISCPH